MTGIHEALELPLIVGPMSGLKGYESASVIRITSQTWHVVKEALGRIAISGVESVAPGVLVY
jgi:hypothetical protein